MKTPWIHHERMQQIRSKQMNIFKSSRVQKKSVCPNFQHREEDDDSHKSDIVPNRIDTAEADDSHENYGIKKVTKLNKNKNNVSKLMNLYKKYNMSKRNHTGSICGPTQPSNRTTDPEHVSSTDDHTLKTDDSHIKQISLPSPSHETKEHPSADSVLEPVHPSSNSDEINDQEDDFETNSFDYSVELAHLLDENNLKQVFPAVNEHAVNTDEASHIKQISLTGLDEQETKDHPPTDSVFELAHDSSSSDKINDQENISETNPIDYTVEPVHSSDNAVPEQSPPAVDEHAVKTDEVSHAEQEINKKSPTDSVFEPVHPSSESDGTNDQKAINFDNADESIKYGKTCSMTIKRPFSTFVEIDDFLHSPIFSNIVQNSAEFLDLNNKQTPQLNTKLLNTTTYYPEQPECRLVCSKIHEMISLTDTVHTYSKNNTNNHYQSIAVPLHDSKAAKTSETDNKTCTSHDFIQIRVPVVAGEYKMEIILEEDVVFEEEILGVKEISKEVVLTNCKFVPTQFSPSLDNGTCTALKGNLFIKGYISQNIEYTAADNGNEGSKQNESVPYYRQLHQKIILDLIVHLLQVQQVRVSYAGNGI